jgi:hypothetical protein
LYRFITDIRVIEVDSQMGKFLGVGHRVDDFKGTVIVDLFVRLQGDGQLCEVA